MALPPEAAGQAAESHSLAGGGAGHKRREKVDHVVIRFAGDSGDGMQLAGMQFTTESALAGNDIATLPDFPAEIRAPAGTLAGVSGFQVNFSSNEIFTAGDEPNVLVAMNPAALKANLDDVPPNGVIQPAPASVTIGRAALPIRPGPRKRTSNEAEDEPRFTLHYLGFCDLAGQIDRPSSEMLTTHWGSRRIV